MNKSELTAAMAEKAGISKKDAAAALDAFVEVVTDDLKQGGKVQLIGFGSFEVKDRSARMGRDPRTGAHVYIAASKLPAFKAGKALKDAVNGK